MIGFDVVHDRNGRPQRQEGFVVLIGLHDEQVITTEVGIPTPFSDSAACESRRISPGGRESLCDHDRGGRLAVRPGDRHEARSSAGYQLPQGVGAPYDRYVQGPGPLQFRMGGRDRRGHDNCPRPIDMARVVALRNRNSQGGQVDDPRPGSISITTSYGDSPVPGNQRQGAHPRPGYAHEMDGTGIPGSKQGHLWAANIRNLFNLRKL